MSASTTFDSDNAAPLVAYQTIAAEFVELLRGLSVVSRIQGLRRVPFDIRVSRETLASTQWHGSASLCQHQRARQRSMTFGWAVQRWPESLH